MKFEKLEHTGRMDRSNPEILFASLQTLLDTLPEMIFVKDMNLAYVAGTKLFANMTGKDTVEEIIGLTDYDIFDSKDLALRYVADDRLLLDRGDSLIDIFEQLTDENGQPRYSSTSKYLLSGPDGTPLGLLGISKDVTHEFKAQQQYQKEIEYLFALPSDAYGAVLFNLTDWRIVGERRQMINNYEIPLFDTIENFLSVARVGAQGDVSSFYDQFSPDYLLNLFNQGKRDIVFEYYRTSENDRALWLREEFKFLPDPKNGSLNLMLIIRDIEWKKQSEAAASFDQMTRLLNRAAIVQQVQEYLNGSGADGTHAVYIVNADDFHAASTTHGTHGSDIFLMEVAHVIKNCFEETDLIGRIGNDAFLILAKNMPGPDTVQSQTQRLLEAVRQARSPHTTVRTTFSIGVSMYPQDGSTLDELYGRADAALHTAKERGKNQAAFAWEEVSHTARDKDGLRYDIYNAQVADSSHSPCYITDLETHEILHMTKAAMDLYGMKDPEAYRGKKCYQLLMGRDAPCSYCPCSKLVSGEDYNWEHYNELLKLWFDKRSTLIRLGDRLCHLMVAHDITEQKNQLMLLSGRLSTDQVVLHCLQTLTCEKDTTTAFNQFLTAVGGYYQSKRAYIFEFDPKEQSVRNIFEWCREDASPKFDDLKQLPPEIISAWISAFRDGSEFSVVPLPVDPAKHHDLLLPVDENLLAIPLVQNGKVVGFIAVEAPSQRCGDVALLNSVSEIVKAELNRRRIMSRLERMSYTDSLTGLKNRNHYDEVLKEYAVRTPDSLGVIFVNINGMKSINNTYGNAYGGYIIQKTGQLLKQTLSCTVWRIGGDEFAALIENISRADFDRSMLRLRAAFAGEPECSVSIGCGWQEKEENIQRIFLQASEMQTVEKQAYYQALLQDGPVDNLSGISGEVLKEIEEGRFTVHFQPQVNIHTGAIIGAEALVRKRGEDGSLVPPNKFIPVYEMQGVINHVDLFVMNETCSVLRRWLKQGHHLHLSVNFSRVTLLEADIVQKMQHICETHGVPTSLITVEVTESISKMDHKKLRELIKSITDAGFSISLDDFGSEYSNLSILSDLDFTEIKFDRSLVTALEENQRSRVVMENSIQMCHGLKDTIALAEGIETEGQLNLLRNYCCDSGQGFYFSKPLPMEEFEQLLRSQNSGA